MARALVDLARAAELDHEKFEHNHWPSSLPEEMTPIYMDAWVDDLGNMMRRAKVRGFEIMCDEPEIIGGSGSAPAPLHYFAASILF